MPFWSRFKSNRKFQPDTTYFDLLYSEYKSLDPPVPDGPDKDLLEGIKARRDNQSLPREEMFSWDDIYKFELTLLKYLNPIEKLRAKVLFLRDWFVNIYGNEKLSNYLKDNPLDPATETDETKFRAEARYLLHQIYLSIAALSSREGLSKWLTESSGIVIVIIIGVALLLFFVLPKIGVNGTPIKVAFIAGAVGGLISVLQRIQSVPFEGDPVFNLATFWYGAYALFVSPFTGAVFGVLLYLLFAGGVLVGLIFPNVATPSGAAVDEACGEMTTSKVQAPASPTPAPTPRGGVTSNTSNGNTTGNIGGNTNAGSNTSENKNGETGGNTGGGNTGTSNTNKADNANAGNVNRNANMGTPSPSPTNASPVNTNATNTNTSNTNTSNANSKSQGGTAKIGNSGLRRFLDCSGPASGFDYALLIVWCFIAGFAERLVPDTLDRLASENIPAKKT
jgi:hypothetical protein